MLSIMAATISEKFVRIESMLKLKMLGPIVEL